MTNRRYKLLRFGDWLFGTNFLPAYHAVVAQYNLPTHQRVACQRKKLIELLQHAEQHCTYYGTLLSDIPSADPYERLFQLPLLTRELMIQHADALIAQSHFPKNKLYASQTGGSTGKPRVFYQHPRELDRWRAYQLFFLEQSGYHFRDPLLQIGATQRNKLKACKDFAFGIRYVLTKWLTIQKWQQWSKAFSSGSLQYLFAYPSRIRQLCRLVQQENMGVVPIKGIITIGDKLFKEDVQLWHQLFEATVVETYGATEGLMLGFGINGSALSIMDHDYVIEILDAEGKKCAPHVPGNVVVTSLEAKAMPLLRYPLGDVACWTGEQDHRGAPTLHLIGRAEEMLGKNSRHEWVSVRDVFAWLYAVHTMEHFILTEIDDHSFELGLFFGGRPVIWEESFIQHHLLQQFSIRVVRVVVLEDVPRYPSGKPRFIQWSAGRIQLGNIPWQTAQQ